MRGVSGSGRWNQKIEHPQIRSRNPNAKPFIKLRQLIKGRTLQTGEVIRETGWNENTVKVYLYRLKLWGHVVNFRDDKNDPFSPSRWRLAKYLPEDVIV